MPARRRRPIMKGIEHGVRGYRKGCGCKVCREDWNEYHAGRRHSGNVTPIRAGASGEEFSSPVRVGLMEQAVIDETNGLPSALERPTLVVAARAMARIIDDPKKSGMHPTTNRQLLQLLDSLHAKGKRKSGGRLATVQKMTRSKREIGSNG